MTGTRINRAEFLSSFTGTNRGTADELRRVNWIDANVAFDLGLAVAYVASPGSSENGRSGSNTGQLFGPYFNRYGTRRWADQDQRLIHELLQSGFNSTLAVDYDQIIFMGGSQGTNFLAKFFEQYAGIYGGGFHAWCGAFWGAKSPYSAPWPFVTWIPSFQWTPFSTRFVRSRFRVFVEATTEDFLHADGVAMSEYYSEVLGLDTRWDLEAPGGHCSRGATSRADIWAWLSADSGKRLSSPSLEGDADGDGIANAVDPDDDNDGALDMIDALPLEPKDWLDTDLDGIGDFADRDADGDGVDNSLDPFSLDPREWLDTDEDGMGDRLDADDDNDGIPDDIDPSPLQGTRNDQLTFRMVETGVSDLNDPKRAFVSAGKPAAVVYPTPQGDRQSYQFINLGDGVNPRFEIMIDRFDRKQRCEEVLLPDFCDPEPQFALEHHFEHYIDRIYIDRNHNQNLTDDGPPLILARNNGNRSRRPGVITRLEVPYASGDTFPYGIILWTYEHLSEGVRYRGASAWMGDVQTPFGQPVLVGLVDANIDGVFNQDPACIDLDRNGVLDECDKISLGERVNQVYPEQPFELDGRQHRFVVAPSGHKVNITSVRPLQAPTGLTATAVSSSRIDLTWQDNSSNETGFRVQRRGRRGTWVPIGTTSANTTRFSDGAFLPNNRYRYRVQAFNDTASSAFSNEALTAFPPTVGRFTPTRGPAGVRVTLIGSDFLGATAVRFNGVSSPHFWVKSGWTIVASVPLSATSGPISVVTPVGTAVSTNPFTVLDVGISSRLFVPIVLRSRGRTAGSFFTSELTLTNRGSRDAAILYTYTAAIGSGSGTAVDSLGGGEQRVIPDAIAYLTSLGVPIGGGAAGGTLKVDFSNLPSASDAAVTVRTSTPVEEGRGRAGLAYMGLSPRRPAHRPRLYHRLASEQHGSLQRGRSERRGLQRREHYAESHRLLRRLGSTGEQCCTAGSLLGSGRVPSVQRHPEQGRFREWLCEGGASEWDSGLLCLRGHQRQFQLGRVVCLSGPGKLSGGYEGADPAGPHRSRSFQQRVDGDQLLGLG